MQVKKISSDLSSKLLIQKIFNNFILKNVLICSCGKQILILQFDYYE